MAVKNFDIIRKIYDSIITGISKGKTLIACQGSARAGKSYQIAFFLIQCCQMPELVNKLNLANYISRHKEWEEKVARGESDVSEPQPPESLKTVHASVIRDSLPSLKRSIFRDFVEIMVKLGIYDPKRMNKTEMTYTFENGSVLEFFATADNEQKVRGSKRDILFVNEANEIGEWEFNQLRMRTFSFTIVDFNPSFTEEHWLFKKLDDERTYHFISTFLDNPFLPDAVKEEIMSYKYTNPALWKIFGCGEFAIVEGLVFPKETWDVVDSTEIPVNVKVDKRIGIDIGFSGRGDPTAVTMNYTANINGVKHLWIDELVYEKGLNEKQLAYRLKPYNDIRKYIDSANPLYIQNLEDNGIQLLYPVVKYANSVIDGLTKMQGYKIHIIRGSSNIIKEFNNYCWMKDRHEAYTNTPIDKFNHCFTGNTMISTADGQKPIGEIKVGDLVWTSHGLRPVLETFHNGVQQVWDIAYTMEDGCEVQMSVTPSHKIKTNKGWKLVRNLKRGDKIYLFKSSTGKSIGSTKVSDTSPEAVGDCTLPCGNITMGLFQRVSMCITRMKILLTTLLTIWNCSLNMTICRFMLRNICRMLNFLRKLGQTWPKLANVLKIGIVVKKAEDGIVSTLSSKYESSASVHVSNVEKRIRLLDRVVQDSAPMCVNHDGVELQGLIMKHGSALCAEKNLSQTDSRKSSLVVEHVLERVKLQQKHYEKTYNIMVHDMHEYFAEGVLASNCVDATRYAVMSDRTARTLKHRFSKGELGITF